MRLTLKSHDVVALNFVRQVECQSFRSKTRRVAFVGPSACFGDLRDSIEYQQSAKSSRIAVTDVDANLQIFLPVE